MSEKEKFCDFKLEVSLDASHIEGFGPDQVVKVIARDGEGFVHSPTIRFDSKRRGVATFTFPENPGPLRIYVATSDALESWNGNELDPANGYVGPHIG